MNNHNKSSSTGETYYIVQGGGDALSAHSQSETKFNNKTFKSVEHAFFSTMISSKSPQDAQKIEQCRTPYLAKKEGEAIMDKSPDLKHNWPNSRKRDLMKNILSSKYKHNKQFREKLQRTQNSRILHTVEDQFWGIGSRTGDTKHPLNLNDLHGENQYGKILEEIRSARLDPIEQSFPTNKENKKKLTIIGNSLIEPFDPARIHDDCDTDKISAMTIKDAETAVSKLKENKEKPDIVYLQLISNDLEGTTSPESCAANMKNLCDDL